MATQYASQQLRCVGLGERGTVDPVCFLLPTPQVCLRGPAMFAGYYKQPEMTAETVDKDGFFHTGDLGVWSLQGHLGV
jgi:long-subunit acyl-CoA synthetase (AMP-forming)